MIARWSVTQGRAVRRGRQNQGNGDSGCVVDPAAESRRLLRGSRPGRWPEQGGGRKQRFRSVLLNQSYGRDREGEQAAGPRVPGCWNTDGCRSSSWARTRRNSVLADAFSSSRATRLPSASIDSTWKGTRNGARELPYSVRSIFIAPTTSPPLNSPPTDHFRMRFGGTAGRRARPPRLKLRP